MKPMKVNIMEVVRRNDYLQSISSDISDIDREVRGFNDEIKSLDERASWAKSQKQWRFYLLQRKEIRYLRRRIKRSLRSRKELAKLLAKANDVIK